MARPSGERSLAFQCAFCVLVPSGRDRRYWRSALKLRRALEASKLFFNCFGALARGLVEIHRKRGGTEGAAESKWDDGIEFGDRTRSRGTHEAGIALRRGLSCVFVLGKGVSAGKYNVHTVNKEVD